MIIEVGKTERVSVNHDVDFVDLLREHVSQDAADYYESRVTDLLTSIEEAVRFLEDDTGRYDAMDALDELKSTLHYQGWDV